jgi:GAF domain-containing protein/ANTAR domain-containing protein
MVPGRAGTVTESVARIGGRAAPGREDALTEPLEQTAGWGERSSALAESFVTLADTMGDDFDVLDLMDQLVGSCLGLLRVEAAGLLLRGSKGLKLAASSSEEGRLLGLFQLEYDEGPCLDSVSSGRAVAVDEIGHGADRWPEFAQAAAMLGFGSTYAFPLRLREQTVGGLNLFGVLPDSLGEADQRVGQALADTATIGLLQRERHNRAARAAAQLQGALNSRVVIEQAKGVLAEYAQLDMESAF